MFEGCYLGKESRSNSTEPNTTGRHQGRFEREGTAERGGTTWTVWRRMVKHNRSHIKVGKEADEQDVGRCLLANDNNLVQSICGTASV